MKYLYIYTIKIFIKKYFIIFIAQAIIFSIIMFPVINGSLATGLLNLSDCFMGFQYIDMYCFAWLFLQLPILVIIYNYLVQYYLQIRIYILLKMKSLSNWYIYLFAFSITAIFLYFGLLSIILELLIVGLGLGTFSIDKAYLLQFVNIVIGTYNLVALAFIIWTLKKETHISFLIMLIGYILTVTGAGQGLVIAKFSPFVVSIYSLQTVQYSLPWHQTIIGSFWSVLLSALCYKAGMITSEKNNDF